MSNALINHWFEQTYEFVNCTLLPVYEWDEFNEIFLNRHRERANSVDAWMDVLPIIVSHACGDSFESGIPLAATWSLYLLAGRILDDIQDDAGEGRLWYRGCSRQALPIASFVLGIAQTALARLNSRFQADITDAFGRTMALASQAQRERQSLKLETLSLDNYFHNLVSRTAIVFATACWSGARLVSTDPKILDAFYNYGLAIGTAIQIEDDCQDLIKSDVSKGVYTLPIIYSLSQTHHPCYPNLLELLSMDKDNSVGRVDDIARILLEMSAFQWSQQMAKIHRVKAMNAITPILSALDLTQLKTFAIGNF